MNEPSLYTFRLSFDFWHLTGKPEKERVSGTPLFSTRYFAVSHTEIEWRCDQTGDSGVGAAIQGGVQGAAGKELWLPGSFSAAERSPASLQEVCPPCGTLLH